MLSMMLSINIDRGESLSQLHLLNFDCVYRILKLKLASVLNEFFESVKREAPLFIIALRFFNLLLSDCSLHMVTLNSIRIY